MGDLALGVGGVSAPGLLLLLGQGDLLGDAGHLVLQSSQLLSHLHGYVVAPAAQQTCIPYA